MTAPAPHPSPDDAGEDARGGSGAGVPAVSIVIPAYNRAPTIRAAIESVLRQTWQDFELIVVDDGSTDGTVAAVRAVADPRLRLIESPRNAGASAARNRGLRAARGAWVAFQDSDDEWLPAKLARQMARLTAPGADHVAAYCGMLVIGTPEGRADGRDGARPHLKYVPALALPACEVEGDILPALLRTSLVSTQTLVARRDRLLEIGGFDEEIAILIDWECVIRLAPLGSIALVDEPLVLQRFSANSITLDHAKRERTRRRIVGKHLETFRAHPRALALQYHMIGAASRKAGELADARVHLWKSCRLDPLRWRSWGMLGYVLALSLLPGRRR